MIWRALTLAAALIFAAPAFAQSTRPIAAQRELEAARTTAMRPGDERLSCRLLQREMNALLRDRQVQRYLSEQELVARGDIFDAFVAARLANDIALLEAQQNRLGDQMDKLHAVTAKMEEVLPQFMRGERVRNLGRARNCGFARAPPCRHC